MPYLIEKYGTPEHLSLYPKNIETRATIHQRLLFDCGILFPRLRAVMVCRILYSHWLSFRWWHKTPFPENFAKTGQKHLSSHINTI